MMARIQMIMTNPHLKKLVKRIQVYWSKRACDDQKNSRMVESLKNHMRFPLVSNK